MEVPAAGVKHCLQVYINDGAFSARNCSVFSELLADLVDLAVAVYTADWLSVRRAEKVYVIRVTLPVRNPNLLGSERSLNLLGSTLKWFTGDHWHFEFYSREMPGRSAERQDCIPVDIDTEVALWSGGLDSFAGLINRMAHSEDKVFTLFGTGCNKHINGVQQKLAAALRTNSSPRINLIQVPFHINHAKHIRKNPKLRARGFTFLLLGSVCAKLKNRDRLLVYENGIGAVNLPFRASEVGLDHSRSVHPVSLFRMTELLSFWLRDNFRFENPFLFQTKAQMCEIFKDRPEADLIPLTISCDSRPRQKDIPIQCGFCSSCLLRRQALAAGCNKDETIYAINKNLSVKQRHKLHFKAMQYQLENLRMIIESDDPWRRITKRFQDLSDIADLPGNGFLGDSPERLLLQLYERYVREWDRVHDIVGRDLTG